MSNAQRHFTAAVMFALLGLTAIAGHMRLPLAVLFWVVATLGVLALAFTHWPRDVRYPVFDGGDALFEAYDEMHLLDEPVEVNGRVYTHSARRHMFGLTAGEVLARLDGDGLDVAERYYH